MECGRKTDLQVAVLVNENVAGFLFDKQLASAMEDR